MYMEVAMHTNYKASKSFSLQSHTPACFHTSVCSQQSSPTTSSQASPLAPPSVHTSTTTHCIFVWHLGSPEPCHSRTSQPRCAWTGRLGATGTLRSSGRAPTWCGRPAGETYGVPPLWLPCCRSQPIAAGLARLHRRQRSVYMQLELRYL